MASYPSAKVHRPSRRQLGKGQTIPIPPVTCTPTVSTTTVTLTFSAPVIVSGNINMHMAGLTLVSQTITSPTVVTQVYSATAATAAWSLTANDPTVKSFQGGGLAGASGTF